MCGPIGDVLAGSSHSRSSLDHMLLESSADDLAFAEGPSTSPGPTRFDESHTLVPDDIVQNAPNASLQVVDRPDPIASRMITEQDEDDTPTGEAVTPRPVIRGKSIECMAKQALAAASFEATGQTDSERIDGDDDISREDINDVANDRQLRPYHDLSTASDEFIRRRRDCILKVRSEQLGTIYNPETTVSFAPHISSHIHTKESWTSDSTNEDDVMDNETRASIKASLSRAGSTLSIGKKVQSIDLDDASCNDEELIDEEEHHRPVRLSKRQATLAAQGKLKKLSSSFVDEASDEEYEDGKSTPPKRGRRRAARLKRSGSGSGRLVNGKSPKKAEFPIKLHKMLDEVDPDIAAWLPHGRAFRVNDIEAFVEEVLPAYGFNQSKITSFYRQLNLYGFSRMIKGPDAGGYYHECFLRGKPNLIGGMVRVKVKGGGNRPKPSEIAKTQPNFYAMPPIDAEADGVAASNTGEKVVAKKKASKKSSKVANKKTASPSEKKRKSKSKKASDSSSSPEVSPSREIIISPIPLIEPDGFEPIAIGSGVVEDCGDEVPMPIKRSSVPSQVLLEYHRQHPTIQRSSDFKLNEITPSPVPPRVFNASSSHASFHEHVHPPPLYSNPAQSPTPAFATFSSSTFHMHQHMLKQQKAASARSVMGFPNTMVPTDNDDSDQRPGESSNQKARDAELLVEDWYNIKKPSSTTSQDLLGRDTDAADELWLPSAPINVPVEQEDGYLAAVENAKDDTEFGRVLDAFLDSL